jgi:uncharacterized protein YjbJ (UPF0337 family)
MSTATEHTVKGKFNEVAGKVKQTIGESTHNDKLANEGAAQQVKGHAEQAWGSVKQAATDAKQNFDVAVDDYKARHATEHEQQAHDIREKVTSTAANAKDHIQNTLDNNK